MALPQRVKIADHLENLAWNQGEHVIVIGPTGSGKSMLTSRIIQKRIDAGGYITMPITKTEDDTFKSGAFRDFDTITDWNPGKGQPRRDQPLTMLWPKLKRGQNGKDFLATQRDVFGRFLNEVHHKGRRTVLIDEMHMMTDPNFIGLGHEIALLFHQGRSSGTTMVVLTQRPSWVPLIIYPSVSHVYVSRTNFDRPRLAQLTGLKPKELDHVLDALPSKHDFVYFNPAGTAPAQVVNVKY